jgi:hypothetical protein
MITLFTGLDVHNMIIKEEPQSPVPLLHTQCRVHTTTDANAIGHMDPMDVDSKPSRTVGKRRSTVTSGPYRVRFGGIRGLPRPAQTGANVIGHMDPMDIDTNPSRTVGKHTTTVVRGPARVRFGSIPRPEMPPRRSIRVSKAKSRKESTERFSQLAQGFHTIANTCEELGDTME